MTITTTKLNGIKKLFEKEKRKLINKKKEKGNTDLTDATDKN